MSKFSNTQINNLGNRLRRGERTINDVKMLDMFRRSFGSIYEQTMQFLSEELHLSPTGRPAKSTNSIIEKLEREKSRLVTIQDIAGCRIVLTDCKEQDKLVQSLTEHFNSNNIVDRRLKPSFGYRAVHFVAYVGDKPIEIQIRTTLQHLWAELSERLSDIYRPIKYGGGPPKIRSILDSLSERISKYEELETRFLSFTSQNAELKEDVLASVKEDMANLKLDIEQELKDFIDILE